MKTGVIIPVFNVGERLRPLLADLVGYVHKKHIYIINDGSTDGSMDSIRKEGYTVFDHSQNRGKGEALKSGFFLAIRSDLEAVITLDGDGQHDPGYIPEFIRIANKKKADLVLGLRSFKPGIMPPDRIFANYVTSLITSIAAGHRILDSQNGYRLIRTNVLKNLDLKTSHYELETEILIKAARKKYTIAYCPISLIYEGAASHIHRLRDSLRFCSLILKSFSQSDQ